MRLSILLALPLWSIPSSILGQPLDSKHVDELAQQALRAWNVPGSAVVVVRDGQIATCKGYGVRSQVERVPVTTETIFPLASCTKAFTSAAVAHLVQQRTLSWDDPVRRHLPDFKLYERGATELVTLRDLLSHRTGVGGHDLLWYRAPWSQDESIRRIGLTAPSGPFRSSFYYQSIMYMAIGQVVAKHHRLGWAGYVRDHFLRPLAMNQTDVTYQDALRRKDVAAGHRKAPDGKIVVTPWHRQDEPNSAGSIALSAQDLAKWLRFQLTGRGTADRILTLEALVETHKPHTVVPHEGFSKLLHPETVQLSYAQGWLVQDYRGLKLVQHGGLIDGFRVHLTLAPEHNLAIGVMCNLHDSRMPLALSNNLVDYCLGLSARDWNGYYTALMRADERESQAAQRRRENGRDHTVKPSIPAMQLAGAYEHPAYGRCVVRLKDGRLMWEWSSFQKLLEPYRGDVFEIRDDILANPLVEFEVKDGAVVALRTLDVVFQRK